MVPMQSHLLIDILLKISSMERIKKNMLYYIYIIECEGDRLYTGITTDYVRRYKEHLRVDNEKKGAKFTKSFKPQKMLSLWSTNTKSNALKLEYRIKTLAKEDKLRLISNDKLFSKYFSEYIDKKDFKKRKICINI